MAARKLQQEVEKCFKRVNEGIAEFDEIYEKIEQSSNQAQKEKLEDNLKREIKKLQRMRDQIKTWTQSNDIKDKGPLMDYRRLIESRMEQFKAVEKLMKTKAFSKEGLSAQATLDPREKAKVEASDFLGTQIDELEQQIETLEAEREAMGSVKKGKKSKDNAARLVDIEAVIEKHKWHQGKLELIRRALVNDSVEAEEVNEIKDQIQYYVQEGQSAEYHGDEGMYDDLDLDEEEDNFGMGQEHDRVSSQDTQSVQDEIPDAPEVRSSSTVARGKERASADAPTTTVRKPPSQLKSPLPTLATLHTPTLPTIGSGPAANTAGMKPAAVPTRPPGEGLKYASAAAAAADKNNVGIAPLPPPPSANPAVNLAASQSKPSSTSSPSLASVQMAASSQSAESKTAPVPTTTVSASSNVPTPAPSTPKPESLKPIQPRAGGKTPAAAAEPSAPHVNGVSNGVKAAEPVEDESIYHLPSSLGDLVECWEVTKANAQPPTNPSTQRVVAISRETCPDVVDAEPIKTHRPESYWDTSVTWPKDQLALIGNAALYSPSKVDNDTLFYAFYYKQGTYQQYLSARALKDQAWRFHKQYQTWFQRHEEPKNITEEFEQGTYRFFDYESTWMNRRKADFKFAYKFLEDEV
ncbi:general negative regulator of transcription subunit 5 [Gnomoniopsis sp. IMI 355080]|nr:general negative regulator of transcription subunit 5 [Gnomoniopsis sp. IMI 355080]